MLKYLEKLNLVEFVADDYFICIENKISSKIKFDRKTVEMNFSDELLYNDFVFLLEKNYLMIWNFRSYNQFKLKIPLDYMVFSIIRNKDGIYIFENKIFIVKDKILLNLVNETLNEEELNLLAFKYELAIIQKNNYNEILNQSKKQFNFFEINRFFSIKTNFTEKGINFFNNYSKTILYATLLFAVFIFILEFIFSNAYSSKMKLYEELKENNGVIKERLLDYNSKISILNEINSKITNKNFFDRLNSLLLINLNEKFSILNLKINYDLVNLKVSSREQSSVELLSYLENLKFFKNIRLVNSLKQKDIYIIEIEGELNKW